VAGRHFWASQASSLAGAGRGGRAQHVRQLRLLSKNKRRTQRIVMEFESQGQPTRIVHASTWGKEGQHKHKRPCGDRSRMTPRCGDIVVPTLRPQTWGHRRPHLHPICRPCYCCRLQDGPHLHPICRPHYCCCLQDPTTPDARYHPIPSSFC
jgi:hypothetical protein